MFKVEVPDTLIKPLKTLIKCKNKNEAIGKVLLKGHVVADEDFTKIVKLHMLIQKVIGKND